MRIRKIEKFALSGILLSALAIPSLAQSTPKESESTKKSESTSTAKEPRIQAKVYTEVAEPLTPDERRALSLAGAHVLRHVDHAREAVDEKDQKKALERAGKALRLVKIIETALPEHTVHTEISAGKTTYKDKRTVQPLELAIFSEANQVSIYGPIEVAKQEAAGEKEAPPVVRDAKFRYTRMVLDAGDAKTHLQAAEKALKNEKWKVADGALAAIQNSVVLERIETDLPLVSARNNLTLAQQRIEADQIQYAKLALQAAARNLASYAGSFSGEEQEKLKRVSNNIRSLARDLNKNNHTEAKKKIDKWWNQIEGWLAGSA